MTNDPQERTSIKTPREVANRLRELRDVMQARTLGKVSMAHAIEFAVSSASAALAAKGMPKRGPR